MKALGYIFTALTGLGALIALGVALDLGSLLYQEKTAETRGKSNAETKIESAGSRIAIYEKFHDLCAAVQAREAAMDAIRANTTMDDDKKSTALMANEAQRGKLIAQYNSDGRKKHTSERFLSSDLPWSLFPAPYHGSNKTDCAPTR